MSRYFDLVQASEREQAAQARERGEPLPPSPAEDPFDTSLPWTGTRHSLAVLSRPQLGRPEPARASFLRFLAEACFRHPRSFLGIAGTVLLITLLAIWITPRRYQATMQMMVLNTGQNPGSAGITEKDVNAQMELLRSRDVLSQALDQVGAPASPPLVRDQAIDALGRTLRIAPAGNSNLLQLSYRDSSPEKAKDMLQAVASSFVSKQVALLRPSRQPMLAELVERGQRALTAAQQDAVSFQGTTGIASLDVQSAEADPWQERVAAAQRNLELAVLRRDQAVVDDAVEKERIQNLFVAAKPSASSIPVQPRSLVYLASGLFAAMFLALGFCAFVESRRSTLYSPAELEALTGLPTLATVPRQRIEVQK